MTRDAVLRGFILAMTTDAASHIVIHQALSRGGLGHIAMACGAGDFRPDMRGVLEFHQRVGRKAINTLPRNLAFVIEISGYFLDFGFVSGNFGMAEHALSYRRDSGRGTRVGCAVAVQAFQSQCNMRFMRIRNGLVCCKRSGAEQKQGNKTPNGNAREWSPRSCSVQSRRIGQDLPLKFSHHETTLR